MTVIMVVLLICILSACSFGAAKNTYEESGVLTAWAWDPLFNVAALEMAGEYYKQEDEDFKLQIIENG